MRVQLAASLAILAVAVGGAVLLQDPRFAPSPSGAERPAGGPASTTPATSAPAGTTPATSSPATSSTPTTTAETTVSGSTSSATPSGSPVKGIATSEELYFGRPFETIHIPGTYQGVVGPVTLRLQVRKPSGWSTFPLPVVTDESGSFRAYVELGAGHFRLRLVDPSTGTTSQEFQILLF